MHPRLSICRSSLSLRLLHQKLLHTCVHGPHMLRPALPNYRLSQEQACRSDSFTFNVGSKETQQRDGPLKHFVRFLTVATEPHHSDGSQLLITVPLQSDGKEGQADGEEKLSRNKNKGVALRKALENFWTQTKSLKQEGSVHFNRYSCASLIRAGHSSSSSLEASRVIVNEPTSIDIPNTDKNEDPRQNGNVWKVTKTKSKTYVEVHSVVITVGRKPKKNFLQELQQKIDFLHSQSTPLTHIQELLKKRAFLFASPEKLMAVVDALTAFFKSKAIALDVLKANAGILERPIIVLHQRLHLLTEFEVDRETCIRLGTSKSMWTVSVEAYQEGLNFLKGLGLDARARSNLLRRSPTLLRQSESSMRASTDFFERLGYGGPKLLKLLEARPSLFGSSVDTSLMVKLKLLQDWGFSVKEFVSAMRHLSLYSCQHITLRYKFLREQGLSHEVVCKVIRQQPSILALSSKDIKVKLDFLLYKLNRDISELSRFPAYLAYSFEGRIRPRCKALEAVTLSKAPCLSRILSINTACFKKRFNIPDSVTLD